MNTQGFEVTAPVIVSDEEVSGLLACALEGGSNYWYMIEDYQYADGVTRDDFQEGGRFADPDKYWHPAQIIPLHENCAVIIGDKFGDHEPVALNRNSIDKGLRIMSEKYPHHFENIGTANEDAWTGDCFLQCCLFGTCVYG